MNRLFKVVGFPVLLSLAAGICSASSFDFEQVNPAATYGNPSLGGTADTAYWIPLSSLSNLGSIIAGTTKIDIVPVGETCFINCNGNSTETGVASLNSPIFIAGFTTTSGSTSFLSTTLGTFNTGTGGSGDWTNTF